MTIDFLKTKKKFQRFFEWRKQLFVRFCFVQRIALEYIRSLRYIHLCLDIQENIFYWKKSKIRKIFVWHSIFVYLKLDRVIFSEKRSFLFKKRIIDVLTNHLLLQIESNKRRDSCIRFVVSSSTRTWRTNDEEGEERRERWVLLDRIHSRRQWR